MNKVTYEKVLKLNRTYKPLIARAKKCQSVLLEKGINSKFVWANNHYEEFSKKYVCEAYPIPVIEISGIGDIGFNVTECFYEGYFSKQKLLTFNFELLKDVGYFSLYGENDYLKDIYNSSMQFVDIKTLIENSKESSIAINFAFKFKQLNSVLESLMKLTNK